MKKAAQTSGSGAGRGLAFIAFAKLYFILTGYGMQLLLPALLGTAENFGLFAATMNIASVLNNVLIAATLQTVSKRVSEDESRAPEILREGFGIQLVVGSVLSLSLFFSAPILAAKVLLNPPLENYFRIVSVVVFAYALYAAAVGYLNGTRQFGKQAGLDITFSTLRTIGLLVIPALGYGVGGAFVGFASAAVTVLLIALFFVGFGKTSTKPERGSWWRTLSGLWLYQLCLNLILLVDLSVLGRTVAEMGLEQGLSTEAAASLASRFSGLYRAAQTFAFVPYQFILSVTFIVFPLIAKATSSGDHEAAKTYIERAMRLSLIVLLAIAAPIAGASDGVLRIAYSNPEYLVADGALRVLVLGLVAFSLFVIGATVLSGSGRVHQSWKIALASLVVLVVASRTMIVLAGPTEGALVGAATGTAIGASFAFACVGFAIYKQFGALIRPLSVLRILASAAIAATAAGFFPHASRLTAFAALVVGGLTFVVSLLALRELSVGEIRGLLAPVLNRGPKAVT